MGFYLVCDPSVCFTVCEVHSAVSEEHGKGRAESF